MSNLIKTQLMALVALISAMLPDLADRLPAPQVQKVRDALAEAEAVLQGEAVEVEHLDAPGLDMGSMAGALLQKLDGELGRRAEHEGAQLALLHRLASAVERIAPPTATPGD